MKIVTKRDEKFTWIALKDKEGYYYCWFDDRIKSRNMKLAGNLYLTYSSQLSRIREILKKEGHKGGKLVNENYK